MVAFGAKKKIWILKEAQKSSQREIAIFNQGLRQEDPKNKFTPASLDKEE